MSRVKMLLLVAVAAGIIYCGLRLGTPWFENFQFQDDLASIARFDAPNAKTEDDLRALIKKKAATYDIQLADEQIDISSDNGRFTINVNYSVSVDLLPNKTVVLKFADSSAKGTAASKT